MKRPAKQPSQPASKPNKWNIYHIKGTPAVLLGQVEAPDEESAIKRAIEEFKISPSGELNRWPAGAGGSPARLGRHWPMGVRTRGLDIATNAKRQVADAAARAEAKAVVERWNEQLVASRDMLWSPTIRAALIAGTPWLDAFCPGCGTSRAICRRELVIGLLRMRRKIV